MDWKISFFYLIPAVVILLMAMPIVLEIRTSFNPLTNRGVIAFFVFKKQMFCFIFSISGKMIELQNEQNEKKKQIDFNSQEFKIMKNFGSELLDKLRLKFCFIFYNVGVGDAFLGAMLCGVINQIFTQIFVYVKSLKPTASLCVYDTVSYNKLVCELAVRAKISVTLFEIVYSYLHSVIITKRR